MAIIATWTKDECRALQAAYQMKQMEFARVLGVTDRCLRNWRSGAPIGDAGQAALGGALSRATPEIMARFELRIGADSLMQRRDFGRGMAAGALALLGLSTPSEEREHAEWLLAGGKPSRLAISLVRQSLHLAMQLDDTMGAPAAQGQADALARMTAAMAHRAPSHLLADMQGLHAEAMAFAGCVAWDLSDQVTAERLYNVARGLADESEDDELTAYTLCHLSQLATWARRPRIAVDHATAARGWITQTEDTRMYAYVSMRAAEAAALAGQQRASLALLDDAESALDGAAPTVPSASRAYFVGVGLLESYRGSCLSILGDKRAAATASRRAVDLTPAAALPRDRAVTLLELGRSFVMLNDIEGAAEAVGEAVDLSRAQRSPRLHGAIEAERHHLAPWATSSAVRGLDARIAERDIVDG